MSFLKTIMVYPQCLLNFIELLYSRGAAHGNTVQTVWDILRKRVSPVPCFQQPPSDITSRTDPALERHSKPGQYCGDWFSTCFALSVWKLRCRVDLTEGSHCFSFMLWHAHELDDMFSIRSVFFFSLFLIWVLLPFNHFTCVCVCFSASPLERAVTEDEMYITRSTVMFRGKGWPLVHFLNRCSLFGARLLSVSFFSVHCPLPERLGAYTSMCGLGEN